MLGTWLTIVLPDLAGDSTHRPREPLRGLGPDICQQLVMMSSHRRLLVLIESTSCVRVGLQMIEPERARLDAVPSSGQRSVTVAAVSTALP
ncbi:MAG: hypothetical protein R2705_13845 [Ilumatobacteraceae bacterium]